MRAGVRRLKHEIATGKHPLVQRELGLVIVDYLQLVTPLRHTGSREQDISELSRGFKRLAKEERLALLVLAQLNREPEKRPDHRPRLSDLRESGSIEQDADVVLFVHRPEYYARGARGRQGQPAAGELGETTQRGLAELLIAKQRNGPTGRVFVYYHAETTAFRNLAVQPDFDEYDDFPASDEVDPTPDRYA
jgi:replicative DNA helicase